MDLSVITLIITIAGMFIAFFTLRIAIKGVKLAESIFRSTTTIQTETLILNAYKDYMDMMFSDASEEQKTNGTKRFLVVIDLYCRYAIKGYLDNNLFEDNLHFCEECIKTFKDTIKEDKEGYNNIIDYAKKYNISLD